MSEKFIETRDLNCAAMLVSFGCFLKKLRKLGMNDTLWFFEESNEVQKLIERFNQGKIEVNITNFLYQRFMLKSFSAKSLTPIPKTVISLDSLSNKEFIEKIKAGTPYFHIAGDRILQEVYAERSPHIERVKQGIIFPDVTSAKFYLKNVL